MKREKIHLAKYLHDVTTRVTEVWCEGGFVPEEVTETIVYATCPKCLGCLRDDGKLAEQRLAELRVL